MILSGGVAGARDAAFHERITTGIRRIAPGAEVSVLEERPVLGAALLGLDVIGAPVWVAQRLRAAFH